MEYSLKISSHYCWKIFCTKFCGFFRNSYSCIVLPKRRKVNFEFTNTYKFYLAWFRYMLEEELELTRMLSFPLKREGTVCIRLSCWALDKRSHTDPVTLKLLFFHCCKHSSRSFWLREHVWTLAPNPASSFTISFLNSQAETPIVSTQKIYPRHTKRGRWLELVTTNTMPRVPHRSPGRSFP